MVEMSKLDKGGNSGKTDAKESVEDLGIHDMLNSDSIFNNNDMHNGDMQNSIDASHSEIEDIFNPSSDMHNVLSPLVLDDLTSMSNLNGVDPKNAQLVRRIHTPPGAYDGKDSNNTGNTQLIPQASYRNYYPNNLQGNIANASEINHGIDLSKNGNPGMLGVSGKRTNTQKTRPTFVNKLWSMINDEANEKLIKWSDDGMSFIVANKEELVKEVLPKYFKHSNFASFVRQLNMYGWHKVQDVKAGSIQNSADDKWQFVNDYFIKGREDLLENITRQKPNSNQNNNTNNNSRYASKLLLTNDASVNANDPALSENVNMNITTLLNEVEKLKYNQMAISKDLLRVSKDNELLWKENMLARERHRSQQDALQKILRFLSNAIPHLDQKMLTDRVMEPNDDENTTNSFRAENLHHNLNELNKNFIGYQGEITSPNVFSDKLTNDTFANNNEMNSLNFDFNKNDHDQHITNISPSTPLQSEFTAKPRYLLENRTEPHSKSQASLSSLDSSGRISEIPDQEHDESDKSILNDPQNIINNLEYNIKEQSSRIQHLEDMVNVMSPNGFDLQDIFNGETNQQNAETQPDTPDTLFRLPPDDTTPKQTKNPKIIETVSEEPPTKKFKQ